MKKELIITFGIILVFAIVVSIISIRKELPGILKEDRNWHDVEVRKTGLDPSLLTTSQKEVVGELNWSYIGDFEETEYSNPGNNPIQFERDWNTERLVDRDLDSPLDPEVYLFEEEEGRFFLLATFTTPYNYNTDPQDLGFIDIGYSNNFEISCYYTISYIDNEEEYILQSSVAVLDENRYIAIKQNSKSIGFIKTPELIYTFSCFISPTEDNDLENDMYLSLDLNFYYKIDHEVEKVQLGFSEFKITKAYNEYTVTRRSIIYEGGM